MDYLTEYLPSNNALALAIASLIFIVSVALVAKKVISFLITLILLFIAIASGMAIANNDLVRQHFMHSNRDKVAPPTDQTPAVQEPKDSASETLDQVRSELAKILHELASMLSSEEQTKTPSQQPPEPASER